MTDIRKQLLVAFEAEHREHLDAIRSALDQAGRSEIDLTDVFRRAHSLKGAARAVDLPAVEEVAHQLETLFSQFLEGQQSLDEPTVATVRRNLDLIEDLVAGVLKPSAPQAQAAPAVATAPRAMESLPPKADAAAPSEAGGSSYLRVAAEQMEELSTSMHQLLAELQANEGIDEDLRQIEVGIRGLRRSWDQLHAQMSVSTAMAQQGLNATRPGAASFAPRLHDFDQGLKHLPVDLDLETDAAHVHIPIGPAGDFAHHVPEAAEHRLGRYERYPIYVLADLPGGLLDGPARMPPLARQGGDSAEQTLQVLVEIAQARGKRGSAAPVGVEPVL